MNETISNTDIDWFIAEAKNTGALDATSKYCNEHAKLASSALNKCNSLGKTDLSNLFNQCLVKENCISLFL